VLLNVLVLRVVVDLFVDLLAHLVDFFTLLAHLFCILSDAYSLVVQTLFLLVYCQLFGLFVRVHFRLLRGPDLIHSSLAPLHNLLQLSELVTLAALERSGILVELLALILLGQDKLLDRLDLQVQLLSLVVVFALGRCLLLLGRLLLLGLQDRDIGPQRVLLARQVLLCDRQLYHLQLVAEDTIFDDLSGLRKLFEFFDVRLGLLGGVWGSEVVRLRNAQR